MIGAQSRSALNISVLDYWLSEVLIRYVQVVSRSQGQRKRCVYA